MAATADRLKAGECGLAAAREALITPRLTALRRAVVTQAPVAIQAGRPAKPMGAASIALVTLRSPTQRSTWRELPAATRALPPARAVSALITPVTAGPPGAALSSPTAEPWRSIPRLLPT